MKRHLFYTFYLALGLTITSCAYDNYDAPNTYFQGRIVYNGEPINVAYNNVNFELWEPGWEKKIAINVPVEQDGSYSTILFKSTYKLIFQSGQGPFRMNRNDETGSDTVMINLNGNQTLDIEVLPYYIIRNPQFSLSGTSPQKVTASCGLEQIIMGVDERNVERVSLYISKTQFVDSRTSVGTHDVSREDIQDLSNINFSVDIPTLNPSQNYVFARIGLKIDGIEDMIFSTVQKIEF